MTDTPSAGELTVMVDQAIEATSDDIAALVDRLDALVDLRDIAHREGHDTFDALANNTRDPIERGRRLALCRRAVSDTNNIKEK